MMQTMNLELFTDEKIPLFAALFRFAGAARQGRNQTWLRTLTGCTPGPPFIKGDEKNSPPFHKGGHGGIL
jgi:hypothetical protein